MGDAIALAERGATSSAQANLVKEPSSTEEKIKMLEAKLAAVQEAFFITRKALIQKDQAEPSLNAYDGDDVNKDGLPVESCLMGITRRVPYVLTIGKDGRYYIGDNVFTSLSAAAEHVSGVRRSGWVFWKLLDGRTVKEVFKEK